MLSGRGVGLPDNPLGVSWHDSNWIPILNSNNVLDYFSERSNPFYDRSCNNEAIKMQRLSMDNLSNMVGLEYCLLHVQEPILYVVRKQHRHSPSQSTPIADYYIIAGTVYQAPDLLTFINSHMMSSAYHLETAFEELNSLARFHPSKGYSWDNRKTNSGAVAAPPPSPVKVPTKRDSEESSSQFQRLRVDMLLVELTRKFPLPLPQSLVPASTNSNNNAIPNDVNKVETKKEVKQENISDTNVKHEFPSINSLSPTMRPPPEKKFKPS
ncbi:mediator of RNA polymerase II transcription subunit 6 [Daktulosphaira vitifoliae]|uniref:mediator of RNA polymerase II transcription subunit 6 n=1 Tax=Daktulosphaira vitifoliae TaxID=58002 RepID=UPI0021AA5426|nr:mediator of RNA polymerase II transcription subunit 6 [Daktulosphaira vitifoliae]